MIKVTLFGAGGRMGRAVVESLNHEEDIKIYHAVDISSRAGDKVGNSVLEGDGDYTDFRSDVWIDVSVSNSAYEHALRAERLEIPILIGTTGFSDRQIERLHTLKVAHIIAPNLSPGINLIFEFIPYIREILGDKYDIAVSETHHRHKVDAPSGTAKRIIDSLQTDKQDIQVNCLRMGEIVGEHRIRFVAAGEELEIVHRANSRQAFAGGVAPAVRFLNGKISGEYSMKDVLGLKWQE